jgi:hypothetical protein
MGPPDPARAMWTSDELREQLRQQCGVRAGDVLIVHSSLKSLGWVAGGPKAVVAAYLKRPRFELYDLESDPHEVRRGCQARGPAGTDEAQPQGVPGTHEGSVDRQVAPRVTRRIDGHNVPRIPAERPAHGEPPSGLPRRGKPGELIDLKHSIAVRKSSARVP